MKQSELDKILEDHKLWLKDNTKGKKADSSQARKGQARAEGYPYGQGNESDP